jgi:hypothetical protein
LYAVVDLSACANSPANPSGTNTTGTPSLSSPANGAQIANLNQPVTLTIVNVATTGSSATYTFELATDAAFASKIATKTVPAGANGSTSVALDPLSAGHDYYWHARVTVGDSTGQFSSASKFTIGSAVVLQPPTPISPLSGGSSSTRPTLIVANAVISGATGAIVYRFEISASSSFGALLNSGTVPAGIGQTSFVPTVDLPIGATYFWHAQAFDATNNASSAFSDAQSVSTILTIDLTTVNYQRFVNVSNWKLTDHIISVDQDGNSGNMCINHTKAGLWPTSDFLGDPSVQVEANQWYFAYINGQWYGGAGEWLKPGQICKSGQMSESIGPDGTWDGPMDTWRPQAGELVGYMITTPARSYPDMHTLDERSDIVVQPWHDSRVNTASVRRRR